MTPKVKNNRSGFREQIFSELGKLYKGARELSDEEIFSSKMEIIDMCKEYTGIDSKYYFPDLMMARLNNELAIQERTKDIYHEQGDSTKLLDIAEKSLAAAFNKIGGMDKLGPALAPDFALNYHILGQRSQNNNQESKSLNHYLKSYNLYKKAPADHKNGRSQYDMAMDAQCIADLCWDAGDTKKALHYYSATIDHLENVPNCDPELIKEKCIDLAELHRATDDLGKANKYYKKVGFDKSELSKIPKAEASPTNTTEVGR